MAIKLTKRQLRQRSWAKRNKEHIIEYGKAYYLRNKQRIIAYSCKWNEENKKQYKENLRKWWKENKEHIRQYTLIQGRFWRKANPTLVKASWKRTYANHRDKILGKHKEYYKKNKTVIQARIKKWMKLNIEKCRAYNRKRRIISRLVEGSHTTEEWIKLRALTKGVCPCCKKKVGLSKLSQDHIIPITKNGTDYIWNIQPLCKTCNTRKGNRHATKY